MDRTVERWCVWSALVMAALFVIGFVGFAHLWPPSSPHQSAESLAGFIDDHRTSIRVGLMLTAVAAAFLAPFLAIISVQMRRIEGERSPLAYAQLALAGIFVLEFIVPIFIMQTLLYRERSLEETLLVSDMFWLFFVGVVSTSMLEWALIGIAILRDRSPQPLYPRWVGYVNLWLALIFCSGEFVVFFKDGPLAWNGALSWYATVIGFFIWMVVMVITTLQAIDKPYTRPKTAEAR